MNLDLPFKYISKSNQKSPKSGSLHYLPQFGILNALQYICTNFRPVLEFLKPRPSLGIPDPWILVKVEFPAVVFTPKETVVGHSETLK
jgi:hypothetical protein